MEEEDRNSWGCSNNFDGDKIYGFDEDLVNIEWGEIKGKKWEWIKDWWIYNGDWIWFRLEEMNREGDWKNNEDWRRKKKGGWGRDYDWKILDRNWN